jgi:GDPmannose 4,6-dehydratase
MKRALIVGCRGQDGRLLGELLASRGYGVWGLSRQGIDLPEGADTPPKLAEWTKKPPALLEDAAATAALVTSICPDEIYYLAAFHHSSQQTASADARAIWEASMAVNASGPVNFLEAMRVHSPRTRLFYAGSCLAFGRADETPQTEDTCFRPECVYGISKAAGTHAVRLYREKHGLFAVTGILYNHESHLRPPHFLSRKIVRAAWRISRGLENELVLADLNARTDWGYAPDFVDAFRMALAAGTPLDYVIATGTTHGVLDWVEEAFALAGLDWRKHVREDKALAARSRPKMAGDISRIREACGWSPSTSFERMVELIYENEGNAG